MVERNTRIKYNQIASVRPNDMDATNELVDTYVPAYDAATGKFTWVTAAETTTTIGSLINGADAKTTPVDADMVGLMDSAAANILKKLSWSNIKATLKTYFDTLYSTAVKATGAEIDTGTDDAKFATSKALQDSSIPKGVGNENPTNLLSNGDFEAWSAGTAVAPDGWALVGASGTVAREGTIIKVDTYSMAITRAGTNCYAYPLAYATPPKGYLYYRSRTVTAGCWVYATVADRARIIIQDGIAAGAGSSYHTGNSTWQWLTVTGTLPSNSIHLYLACEVNTGDTTAYFDGAMLVEGSSAFAFADKPMPEVNPTARGILTLEQGQIKFPATQSASADVNTLDDYEEGTWEAVITCATSGTVTLNASFDDCAYTKIGRVVHIRGYLVVSSVSSPVGDIRISLPFTQSPGGAFTQGAGSVIVANIDSSSVQDYNITFGQNVAYCRISETMNNASFDYVEGADLSGNEQFMFSADYIVE